MYPNGVMVTVRTSTEVEDKYGDVTGSPTETSWGPCAVAPRASTENADNSGPAVITGMTVYGPVTGAPTSAADQLVIRGFTYNIVGIPGDWTHPYTGWAPGVEVAVERASAT